MTFFARRTGAALLPLALLGAGLMACDEAADPEPIEVETEEAGDPQPELSDVQPYRPGTSDGVGPRNAPAGTAPVYNVQDRFLELEVLDGEAAMTRVSAWNAKTEGELQDDPLYGALRQQALAVLNNEARIPEPEFRGGMIYNFWRDEENVRGVWRRTDEESYFAGEPEWQVLLDLDALAEEEGENWVWDGASCMPETDRCMVSLSRGGKDASVSREYGLDVRSLTDGFYIPETKHAFAWMDSETLLVSTDWNAVGGGDTGQAENSTVTEAGYPFVVKRWSQGQTLAEAETVFTGEPSDVGVWPRVVHVNPMERHVFIQRVPAGFETEYHYMREDGLEKLPLPLRSDLMGVLDGKAVVMLEEEWSHEGTDFASGDVVALDLETMAAETAFSPSDSQAVRDVEVLSDSLAIALLDNVAGKLMRVTPGDGGWSAEEIPMPDNGMVSISAASNDRPDFLARYAALTVPDTLYRVTAGNETRRIMQLPSFFDASDVAVEQRFAESPDGTRVPYFIMAKQEVLEEGNAPTIQYGYGGFNIPVLPQYFGNRPQHAAFAGRMWIERGGVLVLSNIRGGGEFGPKWHQAAMKENRQRAFDDFFAIAEDLIADGVTTREKLGAIGRSNGGLLMGVALTQRPDLYAALDIGVPLIDMLRYDRLLAGASWQGEYGDPEIPEQREYIEAYSPYQNLKADADYPEIFIYTSTMDDRVHPGHARRLAAKLEELGHDFYYYENTEGGHGGAANQEQLAHRTALEYLFFVRTLMDEEEAAMDEAGG